MNYHENLDLQQAVRELMAIAFLPEEMTEPVFDDMRQNAMNELLPLFEYFHRQWFENVHSSLWNMFQVRRRTNDHVEGWHLRFNRLIDRIHPNINDLIRRFQVEQANTETKIMQIAAGQMVIKPNKLYQKIDRRIQTLTTRFDEGQIEIQDFLRGIAYDLAKPVGL